MDKFCAKYKDFVSSPIILHSDDVQIYNNLTFLPIYMTLVILE